MIYHFQSGLFLVTFGSLPRTISWGPSLSNLCCHIDRRWCAEYPCKDIYRARKRKIHTQKGDCETPQNIYSICVTTISHLSYILLVPFLLPATPFAIPLRAAGIVRGRSSQGYKAYSFGPFSLPLGSSIFLMIFLLLVFSFLTALFNAHFNQPSIYSIGKFHL